MTTLPALRVPDHIHQGHVQRLAYRLRLVEREHPPARECAADRRLADPSAPRQLDLLHIQVGGELTETPRHGRAERISHGR